MPKSTENKNDEVSEESNGESVRIEIRQNGSNKPSESSPLLNSRKISFGATNGIMMERPITYDQVLAIPVKATPVQTVYLKNYWKILLLTAIFYLVPSMQFVIIQYQTYLSGDTNSCYYNFKCAQKIPFFNLDAAFNNILSNIFYLLCGGGFMLLVRIDSYKRVKKMRDKRLSVNLPIEVQTEIMEKEAQYRNEGNDTGTGLHNDQSLYYCLALSLILEGIFSALYHVCPSRLNFQFDSTFMLIGSSLLFLTLYQKRQPTLLGGVFRMYGGMAAAILGTTLALVSMPASLFWGVVVFSWTYFSALGSYNLYFFKRVRWNRSNLYSLLHQLTHPSIPHDKLRFAFITIANTLNYVIVGYSVKNGMQHDSTKEFPSVLLGLAVMDSLIYVLYYVCMKYRSGETVWPRCWASLMFTFVFAGSALNFFMIGTTNKFLTPDQSRAMNKPCVVFGYFDDHDVWHFLSSFAILFLYLAVYWLDLDIEEKPREIIKVF